MARPAEFDRGLALSAATQLFWRQGYATTSMSQLLEAMSLSRSSFYAAFGDKRQLYVEVLKHFANGAQRLFQPLNDCTDPRALVERYLELAFSIGDRELSQGCMMVNTILEQAGVDDELARLAAELIGDVEAILIAGFQRAQDAGKLSARQSPRSLARLLMNLSQGLRVSARVSGKHYIDDVVETTLSLIDA